MTSVSNLSPGHGIESPEGTEEDIVEFVDDAEVDVILETRNPLERFLLFLS
jgi:hypothetical protein